MLMDELTIQVIAIGGIFTLAFVVTGVILLIKMPRGKVAEVEVVPDHPFELACAPANGKHYKLWVRYSAAYDLGPDGGFGITLDLDGKVGDEVVLDHPLGIGGDQAPEVELVQNTEMFAKRNRGPGGGTRAATMMLYDLGPRPRGSEIVIRGTVTARPATTVLGLKLWIAR